MNERDPDLRKIYEYVHNVSLQNPTYEIHHIIPYEKIKKCNLKHAYIDHIVNLICLEKDVHNELSKEIQNDHRFFKIVFHDNYNQVSFQDIRNTGKCFNYKKITKFTNGKEIFYNTDLAPFIEVYNQYLLLSRYKDQLEGNWK